jgi:aldose 1-epimerase
MDSPRTVTLLRAGHAEAGVAPRIGGSLTHFSWHDGARTTHWLRCSAAADRVDGPADRLACFPLVPFSNRIRDGRFTFRGRAVTLPLNQLPQAHAEHGHGWQAPWAVVAADGASVTLEYDHPADAWPYPYGARQDIVLTEDTLRITLSVENRGVEAMPVGLGLHPYFPSTPACSLAAAVDAMWATDDEVMPTRLVSADRRLGRTGGLPLAATPLDNAFTGWRHNAAIAWPERRARLVLDADTPLDFLVVYSPPGGDHFCVEPVSHCTDAFNLAAQGRDDTGMVTLEPGRTVATTVRFRPRFEE